MRQGDMGDILFCDGHINHLPLNVCVKGTRFRSLQSFDNRFFQQTYLLAVVTTSPA
nr:MAG TPA: hypothetical protein [Caudoviricetes sp.]DAS04207.1 MAG TPA: hypothetical protein [Caudoviricetes sp.]